MSNFHKHLEESVLEDELTYYTRLFSTLGDHIDPEQYAKEYIARKQELLKSLNFNKADIVKPDITLDQLVRKTSIKRFEDNVIHVNFKEKRRI